MLTRPASPIEERFENTIRPLLRDDVKLEPEVTVKTHRGDFRLDFLVTLWSGYHFGIECDGQTFHSPRRDEWRDACIIGDGFVDDMVRVPGADIVYHLQDVVFILARWFPSMFSASSHPKIEIAASTAAVDFINKNTTAGLARFPSGDGGIVNVERRTGGMNDIWGILYDVSRAYPEGLGLDEMMGRFESDCPFPESVEKNVDGSMWVSKSGGRWVSLSGSSMRTKWNEGDTQ